jgi:hypothetical protein
VPRGVLEVGCHAVRLYSWIRLPRTSRRRSCRTAAAGSASSQHSDGWGADEPRPRWGRWRLQGRPGARCSPFDEPVSPDRPPNPACRSSRHRALHEARRNGCDGARLRSTRPALPGRDAGVHRRLLPCRSATAASLCPFAMCTPLACSDYYGHSATTRHQQRTTHLPTTRRWGGRPRVASHVHHHPVDEVGVQLYPGSLARGTPQPFPLASWPATTYRLRSRSPPSRRACTADRPRSARLEPARRLRSVNAGSSRTPSRLACRTRAVWQYRPVPALSGLLPPSRASPQSGCPQLHRPAATGQRRGPSIPARSW